MQTSDVLGEFEQLVLLAVLRLGADAYGMSVRREISARAGRDVAIGAVYTTLERLEAKGLVRSRTGEPTPERGGRARRIFVVTAGGVRAINRSHQTLASMLDGLSFPLPLPGKRR